MKAFPRAQSAGFTLTELMLTVAVLGVLVAVGMPSFTKAIRNAEIRSAAESVSGGIMRARAEAVTHNTKVQFVLGTGTAWDVNYVTNPVNPPLDSRASTDSVHATLTAVASDLATAATTITFNQLGQVVANSPVSPSLAQVTFSATGGNQTLLVKIGTGGNSKVCDPSLPASNFRSCLYG